MSAFGENLRRYRGAAGLSRRELARRAGLNENTVKNWEYCGTSRPRDDALHAAARVLGVTAEQLLAQPEDAPGTCEVWRIGYGRACDDSPAYPFRARCACGHPMAGLACAACAGSPQPGCLTCWEEKHHRCETTVTLGEEAAA